MQQQIRRSVFETNSSSSHSLTLDRTALVEQPFSKELLRKGIVYVASDDFGWEWKRLYTPLNKLRYLVTHLFAFYGHDESLEQSHPMRMLRKVVADHTGCTLEVADYNGCIDHESSGTASESFANETTLHAFLFGKDSFVETGNDNENPPWLIDTDRGTPELYHRARMRDVPEDYVTVQLTVRERRLVTRKGAVLKACVHPEAQSELAARGIVKSVGLSAGPAGFYAEQEPRTLAVSELRLLNDLGALAIARNFKASFRASEKLEKFCLKVKLTVAVPPELAQMLEALPTTADVLLQLREVEEQISAYSQMPRTTSRQAILAELAQERDQLAERAREEGAL